MEESWGARGSAWDHVPSPWLQGTSRREDSPASIHPLAPSSEKTTMASVSKGTWGQAPQLPRGPWQDHSGFSVSPGGLCWRMWGWLETCGQSHWGCCRSRRWRGGVGAGQGMARWPHVLEIPAEWGVSWCMSWWAWGQSAPSRPFHPGQSWSSHWGWTHFKLAMSSCFLAPWYCGHKHHPLPVRQRCQH